MFAAITWWHVHSIDTRGLRAGVEARLVDHCCCMDTRQERVHCAAAPIFHRARRIETISPATPHRGDDQSCTIPTRHRTVGGDARSRTMPPGLVQYARSCTRPTHHKTFSGDAQSCTRPPGLVHDRHTTQLVVAAPSLVHNRPVLYKTDTPQNCKRRHPVLYKTDTPQNF